MSFFGIVLAAGTSSRMQRTKALLRLDGVPLVEHACRMVEEAGATPLVVVGARNEYVTPCIRHRRWVINERYAEGMGTTISAGVGELADRASCICILPVDQPGIDPAHLEKLLQTAQKEGIAATRHPDGNLGAPAAFSRRFFDELIELDGRRGARNLIARKSPTAFEAEFPQDVDTPEDWRRFQRLYERAPHRMPSYPVQAGVLELGSKLVTLEPGGVLMIEDARGPSDLEMYRELGDEDTEPTDTLPDEAALKELAHAAEAIRRRLESFMLDGQVFDTEIFERAFIENAFARAFAQGMVWRIADDGQECDVFLTEDCRMVDLDDRPCSAASVRIPHPLEIDDLASWTEKFAELELVNTIDQLGRPIFGDCGPRELHHVDPLAFHRIGLQLFFEPSKFAPNSYSVALGRQIRNDTILFSASPGYPFHFPDDDEQSIELHILSHSEIVESEACRLWLELMRRLRRAGGYVTYGPD